MKIITRKMVEDVGYKRISSNGYLKNGWWIFIRQSCGSISDRFKPKKENKISYTCNICKLIMELPRKVQ